MIGMQKKLTTKTVEALPPATRKRYEVWDRTLPSFGMRVSSTGRKTWFCTSRANGRLCRRTLGTYPALSLSDAREEARKAMREMQLGIVEAPTLGDTVPMFIELYARPKNRSWREVERLLNQKFSSLFKMRLNQIKRTDIVRILDEMPARGRANHALAAIKKLMNWALDRGMIEVNPITGLKPPTKINARDRILSDDEIVRLLNVTEGYPFGTLYKMLLYTAQRRGEVSEMRWSEVDRNVWVIPASRSKNGLAHEVPLADAVVEMLRAVPRFAGSDFVFTTTGTTPISGFGRAKERVEQAVGSCDWWVHHTELFNELLDALKDFEPDLVILDTAADVFGGNENVRSEVRRFVADCCGQIARETGAAVVLCAHPSQAGLSTGRGHSGSTAWQNTMRNRLYLRRDLTDDGSIVDPDVRFLEVVKSNYGPVGKSIQLRWQDGVLAVDHGKTTSPDQETNERLVIEEIERAFAAEAPRSAHHQGQHRYIVTWIIRELSLSKLRARTLMHKLIDDGRIVEIEFDKHSHSKGLCTAQQAEAHLRNNAAKLSGESAKQ